MTEIDLSRVFRKMPKGEREFSPGVRSLPQKVRGVLILVDGVRSTGQIAQLLPALPVVPSLRALESAGYVGTVVASAGKAAAVPAARARAEAIPELTGPATQPALPLQPEDTWGDMPHWAVSLRQIAIAQIDGLAGSAGAVLVQRLSRARRAGELRVEIQRAAHQLELFVGVEVARLFDEEMSERMRQAALSFSPQKV